MLYLFHFVNYYCLQSVYAKPDGNLNKASIGSYVCLSSLFRIE